MLGSHCLYTASVWQVRGEVMLIFLTAFLKMPFFSCKRWTQQKLYLYFKSACYTSTTSKNLITSKPEKAVQQSNPLSPFCPHLRHECVHMGKTIWTLWLLKTKSQPRQDLLKVWWEIRQHLKSLLCNIKDRLAFGMSWILFDDFFQMHTKPMDKI